MIKCNICGGTAIIQGYDNIAPSYRICCENYKDESHGDIMSDNRRFTNWYKMPKVEALKRAELEWNKMNEV